MQGCVVLQTKVTFSFSYVFDGDFVIVIPPGFTTSKF